jgi:flagellar biosynthesis protein FlhB
MNLNKIIGYVLLSIGLLVISIILWQTYNIFTGRTQIPLVFMTSVAPQEQNNSQDPLAQTNEAIRKQIEKIIPASSITRILNMSSWFMLCFIFIYGGGIVSSIGVKLIKTGGQ